MFNLRNYNDVQVGGGEKTLPAGTYVARIVDAFVTKSKAGNDTLSVNVDIAEGEYTGYFRRQLNRLRAKFPTVRWTSAGTIYCKIYGDDNGLFWAVKKFLETVKQDNPSKFATGNNIDFDETKLKGLIIGITVGNREVEKTDKNGKHYTTAFIDDVVPLEQVRNGSATIPELQKYQANSTPNNSGTVMFDGQPVPEHETPF
ncbi:MAG: hypothetical protein J5497_00200 [Selenomonadaceae bacterium]|nr:hypothetical protein [Selenomonadaceae bacterium]